MKFLSEGKLLELSVSAWNDTLENDDWEAWPWISGLCSLSVWHRSGKYFTSRSFWLMSRRTLESIMSIRTCNNGNYKYEALLCYLQEFKTYIVLHVPTLQCNIILYRICTWIYVYRTKITSILPTNGRFNQEVNSMVAQWNWVAQTLPWSTKNHWHSRIKTRQRLISSIKTRQHLISRIQPFWVMSLNQILWILLSSTLITFVNTFHTLQLERTCAAKNIMLCTEQSSVEDSGIGLESLAWSTGTLQQNTCTKRCRSAGMLRVLPAAKIKVTFVNERTVRKMHKTIDQ